METLAELRRSAKAMFAGSRSGHCVRKVSTGNRSVTYNNPSSRDGCEEISGGDVGVDRKIADSQQSRSLGNL